MDHPRNYGSIVLHGLPDDLVTTTHNELESDMVLTCLQHQHSVNCGKPGLQSDTISPQNKLYAIGKRCEEALAYKSCFLLVFYKNG